VKSEFAYDFLRTMNMTFPPTILNISLLSTITAAEEAIHNSLLEQLDKTTSNDSIFQSFVRMLRQQVWNLFSTNIQLSSQLEQIKLISSEPTFMTKENGREFNWRYKAYSNRCVEHQSNSFCW